MIEPLIPFRQSGHGVRVKGYLLLCVLAFLAGCESKKGPRDLLGEAREAVEAGNLDQAKAIAKSIRPEDAEWADAQILLGEVETSLHGLNAGFPYYESVPRDGSPPSVKAAEAVAEVNLMNGALAPAADGFEYLLKHRPDDVTIHAKLAGILSSSGQRSRAESHLMEVIKKSKLEIKDLVALTQPDRRSDQTQSLHKWIVNYPRDPLVNLGLAVEEIAEQKLTDAKRRLGQIIRTHPQLAEAQALLGELTLDGDLQELESWYARLPNAVQDYAGIWYVRGLWARRTNQNQVAARCFWEAVRQAPTHRRAMYQLGQVMAPLDQSVSEAFSGRAAQLKEYSDLMEKVLIDQGKDRAAFERMIALLMDMGREWEAWAWVSLARDIMGPSGWPARMLDSLSHVPTTNPPRFRADRDMALLHNLSHYPDFDSLKMKSDVSGPPRALRALPPRIQFADEASNLGLEFTYFQSPDTHSHGVRIFESTGGGVGVLDFDHDGWPDLYLTQGEDWPPKKNHSAPSEKYRDRLYRNSGVGFQEVSEFAGLAVEDGYGQGCSCGDFNNDGFTDLYIGNIGVNQLLLNNGDGTFSDVTQKSGITGSAWTTSCLILDLNADGNPDLYDVNYLQGEKVFSVECSATRCLVRDYEGAPDQVQLSQGDGTFVTIPDATPLLNGKGLGIVALFTREEPRPSLFIANDQVPNFFLHPTDTDGRYVDAAMLTGLAFNRDGQTTACMGVAAADLNHDRHTDLFVTNFEGEANTLYLQREEGFFEDAILGTGLMSPGIPYVGWGTQFLDADNNGELDLVVANGHVADFGEKGVEYRMPTQFFRNFGRGKFALENSSELGELFERKMLGRSIATLDWNRDGRMDFVLSSIESPAAVATNQTRDAGHWLGVRLHARFSARDAVGAVVEVHQGEAVHWQQLIAGDGYQASNERRLHIGLGRVDTIDRLIVHWPSGTTSTLASLPVDSTVEVVEGISEAVIWQGAEIRAWRSGKRD